MLILDAGDYFRDRNQVLDRIQRFLGLPRVELADGADPINTNPVKRAEMSPGSREALREFYASHNERLFEDIGTRFAWQ